MKRFLILFFAGLLTFQVNAQGVNNDNPKLVVGIVVDQMRYDYLTRFWNRYGEDGFKRMISNGYNFKNNHFNYIPTYTGPGHASVYTGTSPMNHGIIGNGWFDKFSDEFVYCAGDSTVTSIGTQTNAGKMSPHRMRSTTFGDENRLHTQMRGKTIGIALKDRGAVLPAGHTANAAYWFQGKNEGKWITSSFYMDKLPDWVTNFNNSGKAASYFKDWNTLYNIETYTASGVDENKFEGGFKGNEKATFPYDLNALKAENGEFEMVKVTPYGNNLTTDFAIAAIDGENLGQDDDTDVLTISYSSTDYIGHNFGVNSKEIEDTYLRLDQDIARLLSALDEKVGEGNYTVFLTADHGGVDVPAYLKSVKIPSGIFENEDFDDKLKEFVKNRFDEENLIQHISNHQIFLDYKEVENAELNLKTLEDEIAQYVLQQPYVSNVYTRSQLRNGSFTTGNGMLIQNGFDQKRSGDIIIVLDPATIVYSITGSTHGSGFTYDTHAPLIFFGKGIPAGSTFKRSEIIDIAPTISAILGIAFPSATTGKPLYEMLDKE